MVCMQAKALFMGLMLEDHTMLRTLFRTVVAAVSVVVMSCAAAQPDEPVQVSTRARLTSSYEEPGGKLYVRLKMLPRSKIPFTTQTFRLRDRSLVAGIPEGTWVKFSSRHIDGENVLTSIHAVAECKRFQPCD
jgi:Cu/Ag efflux protein CusF